ncbi:MAG: hypothetical protein KDK34_05180 [Leptospiraceae bacterium]|nr:hypothetical protein [Leptospiraceae bacterium]
MDLYRKIILTRGVRAICLTGAVLLVSAPLKPTGAQEGPESRDDLPETFFEYDARLTAPAVEPGPYSDSPDGYGMLLAQNTAESDGMDVGDVQLGNVRDLTGFSGIRWGSAYSEVQRALEAVATSSTSEEQVEIINAERNKFILVRRNGILYRYNFYKTPYEVQILNDHTLSMDEFDQQEGLLFHVKVIMPFIASGLVKRQLLAIYGRNQRSTFDEDDKNGADIWALNGGFIFLWYEPYRNRPFTRTLDYLNAELAQRIMTEYADYFDAREKLLLQKVLLQ